MILSINSDAHILQLVKNLDKQAIPAILEKYGDALYGIAFHKFQSETLAAEIVQQTFVTAWHQLSNFNEQLDRIFNWVLKIMNRIMAKDYYHQAA